MPSPFANALNRAYSLSTFLAVLCMLVIVVLAYLDNDLFITIITSARDLVKNLIRFIYSGITSLF